MHSIESRFVIGPSDILFASLYVCTFQPGNFTVKELKTKTNKTEKSREKKKKKIHPKTCMSTELIYDHWGVIEDAELSPIHLITTIHHFSGDRAYVLCPVVSSRGLVR